jgi:hypothetical protein
VTCGLSGVLKDMFRSQPLPFLQASLCLTHRCLLVQGEANMKWSLSSQAFCSLNDNIIDFFDWLSLEL